MGLRIGKNNTRRLEPTLPDGAFGVFRRSKRVKRGDIVLVYHPDFGKLVTQVSDISVNGRVALHGLSRLIRDKGGERAVERSDVYGKFLFRIPLLRWRQSRARREAIEPAE